MPGENPFVKDFLKAWARNTIALGAVQQSVLSELQNEPAARQQAEWIYQRELSTDEQRRAVALRLALAEFQVSYEAA